MKPWRLIFALIVAVSLVTACSRESPNTAASSTNVVVFREAGVSVDVGPGWKRVYYSPGPPTCTPTLARSNSIVGACLWAKNDTMREVLGAAHSMHVADTNAVLGSWRQDAFTTGSGLAGQHISHMRTKTKDGKISVRQLHEFLVQREDGRVVSISYDAPASGNSDTVEEMIQSSMKFQ